jgi:hypothetical protein
MSTTYNTSCPDYTDLDGTMVMDGSNTNAPTTYTSTARGAGTITPLGGSNLHFKVSFAGVTKPYRINANSNAGNGYDGTANNNDLEAGEDAWTATAQQPEELTAAAYE